MKPCDSGWTLFDTVLGPCAMAWGPRGILVVQLPEADAAATQMRLLRTMGPLPQALPPPDIAEVLQAVTDQLAGHPQDINAVVPDMGTVTPFQQRVYAQALRIPPGQTCTYGELAEALGSRQLARAVGQALRRNPFAPIVPCHRVLAAHGGIGGFSAHGGAATKLQMLANEGWRPGAICSTAPLFAAARPGE